MIILPRRAPYLQRYGKPIAFYSDKHATFRVKKVGATEGDGMTQFGRALHELNIDIICANAPQAKGRVERANGTLQDTGEGDAAGRNLNYRGRQCIFAGVYGRLQSAVCEGSLQ